MRRRRVPSIAGAVAVAVLVAAAVAGCTGSPSGRAPAIEVSELDGPFDPLDLRIVGLAPGAVVTLVAEAHLDWVAYRSLSRFQADPDGIVDLSRAVPTDGAWREPDPMAPFWSLASDGAPDAWAHFDDEHTVELTVVDGAVEDRDRADGTVLARTQVVRGLPEDSIIVETVTEAGLPAVYAVPADLDERSPRPAVLVMGGSEGGIQTARMTASKLATLGHPALAVSLFRSPGQPGTLAELAIEPVLEAIAWLGAQPGVDADRVTTFGVSRGGELALWLAANRPDLVHGAIQAAGAGELWCGWPDYTRSAWTLGGEPLPCSIRAAHPEPASIIDVAAVDGPVVLACGTVDDIWDACTLQRRTLARLDAAHVDATAVEAEGAGHFLALGPYAPALDGADGAADSAGRAAFWRAVVSALGPPD